MTLTERSPFEVAEPTASVSDVLELARESGVAVAIPESETRGRQRSRG